MTGPGDAAPWESDPVPVLQRWEDSGAFWQVTGARDGELAVELRTCDAGERVSVFRCAERDLAEFLAGRTTNRPD